MDFVRSRFGKMQLWIVEHFVMKKVFNYSELHFSEVTSYKIHVLTAVFFETGAMLTPKK